MIEDMRNLGYRSDVLADTGRGLDYEHSIVAIAALARFHAASYCWRRETGADLKNASSLLRDEKLPAAAASDDFLREIGEILESSGFEKYSGQFLCAARGDIGTMSQKLSKGRSCYYLGLAQLNKATNPFQCISFIFTYLSIINQHRIEKILGLAPPLTGVWPICYQVLTDRTKDYGQNIAVGMLWLVKARSAQFGVVCHGGVARPSLMFKYRHQGDAKQLCQEAALLSLDKCFYG